MSEELDAIRAEAAQYETPAEAVDTVPAQPVAAGPDTLAVELSGLASALVAMLSPMFPSLRPIYTQDTIDAASGAMAAVCRKHGWLNDGVLNGWGEEVACAAVLFPLGVATYQGVRNDLAVMRRREAPDQTQAAEEAPAA